MKINSRIELEIDKEIYPSLVEDIKDGEILVAAPTKHQILLPVALGTELGVLYLSNDAVYRFDSVVVARGLSEGKDLNLLAIRPPGHVERIQRRGWVRVSVDLRVSCAPAKFLEPEEDADPLDGKVSNLSGGGVMLTIDRICDMGDQLLINIRMADGDLTCIGEVRRVVDQEKNLYGVEFLLVSERDRDRIVHYIFKTQLENRKKGLL